MALHLMATSNNPILERKEKWLKIRLNLREQFGRLPDLNAVLMLIGLREVGKVKSKYEKEEKEELMHVGTCTVLSHFGFYKLTHHDRDGWPHFAEHNPIPQMTFKEQEHLLIDGVIVYFESNNLLP